jgi:lipid-A-disaccharide synthase
MGIGEVIVRLPNVLRGMAAISAEAEKRRPDVAILIDYPDFNLRLARRLRRLGIPVVYYIPPKLWVWRSSRARVLRERCSKVLSIFPFEEAFLRKHGVPAVYVGNPLLDELPLQKSRSDARAKFGFSTEDLVLVLMPGSRPAELTRHVPLMFEAAVFCAERLRSEGKLAGRLQAMVPLPETADIEGEWRTLAEKKSAHAPIDFHLGIGDSADALIAADAGLIKSGTSTLEAALLGCPHVVVYKPGWSTQWVFKNLVRYRGPVGLVNLAGGWSDGQPFLAEEILCEQVTSERLAEAAYSLLTDETKRSAMKKGFLALREKLSGDGGAGPSARAAAEILELV